MLRGSIAIGATRQRNRASGGAATGRAGQFTFDRCVDREGTVSGFATAIAVARGSDMVAIVPERHKAALRMGMHTAGLPFRMPSITVSMLWHPRVHADLVHAWLRECVRRVAS